MGNFSLFYIFNLARVRCFFFVSTAQYYKLRLWEKQLHDVIHFSMLYCLAFVQWSPNKNIKECLGVNVRSVQRIRKEIGESNGDYGGMAARETHSLLVLIRKKLPNSFVRFRPWLTSIPRNQCGPEPGTRECLSL